MATYLPPLEDLGIFDSAIFSTDSTYLTIGTARKLFLSYPYAQGTQNFTDITVAGTSTVKKIIQNIIGSSGTSTDNNVQLGDPTTYAALTTGANNVATGYGTLKAVTTGSGNVIIGHDAGTALTTGSFNVAIGRNALNVQTTLSNTIAIGQQAGSGAATTGTSSVAIGHLAASTQLNSNCIVLNATGVSVNSTVGSSTYIAPIRTLTTAGQMLYYNTSSKEITVQSPILNTGFPLTLNLSSTEYLTTFSGSTAFLGSYVSNVAGTATSIAVSGTQYRPLTLTIPVGIHMVTLLETIVVTTPPTAVTRIQKTLATGNNIANPIPGTYLIDTPVDARVTVAGTYQNQYTYIAINTSAAAYSSRFVVQYDFTTAGSFTTNATATTVRIA
tara:strand:- start:24 stop:1181 length:1158 start_codon:yes stop_codon:yes gene_type:complete